MAFLLGLLLGPFFPQLADPQVTYASQLSTVVQQLEKDAATPTPAELEAALKAQAMAMQADAEEPVAKPINGRLLRNLIVPKQVTVAGDHAASEDGQPQNPLVLTGVLRVGQDLVAILNDGSEDFVVAKGSYVRNSMRVLEVKASSVELKNLNADKAGQVVELQLSGGNVAGESK